MSKRKQRQSNLQDNHFQLKSVTPITNTQNIFFDNYNTGKSQVMLGCAGVGKTFLALYKAFEEIQRKDNNYRKVVVVRSAVPTRDVGFLKGSLQEKIEVYELPYKSICAELFGRSDAYEVLKKHNNIEFMTTSFIRGTTLDDCIVIVDEFQNMTAHEADSVITRIGENSKIILCGDVMQRDLNKHSEKNIELVINVLKTMSDCFCFTEFTMDDIVRSGLVSSYIKKKYLAYPSGY